MADWRPSSPHNFAPDYSLFQEKGLVVPDSSFPPHQARPWGWEWVLFCFVFFSLGEKGGDGRRS